MKEQSFSQSQEGATRLSRSGLLGRVAVGLGTLAAGGAAAAGFASAGGASSLTARDREILRLALELEHLQAAFYAAALAGGRLTGETRQFAVVVGGEERAHLAYLQKALGSPAGTASRYRFGDATSSNASFTAAAVKLEDTGLAAYNGQAENLSRPALAFVARVISVEARHAAWVRSLDGQLPAPAAVDTPITAAAAIESIHPYLA